MRFTLAAAAIVLTASIAGGSTISVSVKKSAVEHSKPGQLLLVAFADEPVTADVNVMWQEADEGGLRRSIRSAGGNS